MAQNPMVFIRKDNKSALNTAPCDSHGQRTGQSNAQIGLLLQGMECADAFRFRQTVILATMNQELRCGPFVYEVGRAKSEATP